MRRAGLAALALLAALIARPLLADPVMSAADLRPAQALDGTWTWSIDPFRTGKLGFHGGEPGVGQRRGDDTDVAAARAADPLALYEYDLDHAPAANLPQSWVGFAPEMRHYRGLVWMQRRFDWAGGAPGTRQFLRFGAVDYAAEVWLNGVKIGRHEGGFTPFVIEVTGKLRAQGNRLVVGVDSERGAASVPPPITDWEDYGGITRPVRLIEVPQTYVDQAWVRLDRQGRIAVDAVLDGAGAAGAAVELRIAELGLVLRGKADAAGHWRAVLPAPRKLVRWAPGRAKLYDVELRGGGDSWHDRIGFRTIEVQGAKVLLNGQPITLRGISLHAEELGANPVRRIDDAAARKLLGLAQQGLHANFVRLAHYPHGEEMLRAADAMGLLVWSEVPVYWKVDFANPATLERARAMLAEMIRRDANRAAVAVWSVGNETPVSPERNAFMARLVDDAHALDPTRPVSAALLTERQERAGRSVISLADPLAARLDILAVNTYNGWYGGDAPADLSRIDWQVPADKPLIISEFGADARAGLHDSAAQLHKFSEEYQAEYYRQTLAMLARVPSVVGMSPWILKDFRSPRRQLPGVQDGWNRKGLVSESGEPKLAFAVLAEYYAAQEAAQEAAK